MDSIFGRLILWIGCNALFIASLGQCELDPAKLNYGLYNAFSESVREVTLSNKGQETIYILRIKAGPEIDYQIESKKLEPNQSTRVRLKFRPRAKGVFRYNVEIWISTSDTPLVLPIVSEVISFDPNDHLPCPSFSDEPATPTHDALLRMIVSDSIQHAPIPNATCRISGVEGKGKDFKTDKNGELSLNLPVGFYVFRVEASGYRNFQWQGYINYKTGPFEIALGNLPTVKIVQDIAVDSSVTVDASGFSSSEYKANNVVFLMDISASMGQHGKLELLKSCMEQYAQVIRSQDRIALVSFSKEAHLVLSSQTGEARDSIHKAILNIQANGTTDPVAGFKRSRKELRHHFIQGGNNEIVIFTDGAFSREAEATLKKMIRRASTRNELISLVLISGSSLAQENLKQMIEQGNGSFLTIDSTAENSGAILNMIKTHCKK